MTKLNNSFSLLPALYSEEAKSTSFPFNGSTDHRLDNSSFRTLPAELLQLCLVEYSDWGDLAKLACVQSSWKNLLSDAAATGQDAMWDLAQALLHGSSGLKPNPTLAMNYFIRLSEMDLDEDTNTPIPKTSTDDDHETCRPFVPAMREIAMCYLTGTGVQKNNEKGMAWLKASHTDGHDEDAAYQCAQIYEHGKYDVEVDVYAAFEWFEKAATAGHVEAMAELALCYELGCGVEHSDEKALDWYMKAARLGNATAKYSVGEAFEEARGVPQSDEEACIWYYDAALQGDEDSRQALIRLSDIARIVVPGVGRLLEA